MKKRKKREEVILRNTKSILEFILQAEQTEGIDFAGITMQTMRDFRRATVNGEVLEYIAEMGYDVTAEFFINDEDEFQITILFDGKNLIPENEEKGIIGEVNYKVAQAALVNVIVG